MSGFSTTMEGDWQKYFKQLESFEKMDFKRMHKQVGEALVSNTQLRFMDQQTPEGIPWRPTQRGGHILNKRGLLSSSVTYRATDKLVEVGTNSIYAAIHQFGGVIKAKNKKFLKFKTSRGWVQKKKVRITARPFIGISKEDQQDIETIFQNEVKRILNK